MGLDVGIIPKFYNGFEYIWRSVDGGAKENYC
jgi:hypothetical protein